MSRKQWGHGFYTGYKEAFHAGYQRGKQEPVSKDILDEAYNKHRHILRTKITSVFDGCYVQNGILYLLYPNDGRSIWVSSILEQLDSLHIRHAKAEKHSLVHTCAPVNSVDNVTTP